MNLEAFTEPFPHWTLDGAFRSDVDAVADAVPALDWPGWEAVYDNDVEKGKRTCRKLDRLAPAWAALFAQLHRPSVVDMFAELVGRPLQPDPTLHGAGLHVTAPGGYLGVHIDFALHPFLGLERTLNLILFLNREWREEWGGAFELWNDSATEVVKRIYPQYGRAVIWASSELAYHGTEQVSADAPPRVTAAVYYLAQPRPGTCRKRALFVPRR